MNFNLFFVGSNRVHLLNNKPETMNTKTHQILRNDKSCFFSFHFPGQLSPVEYCVVMIQVDIKCWERLSAICLPQINRLFVVNSPHTVPEKSFAKQSIQWNINLTLTQVSVVSNSGPLLKAGGVVKALNDHFILPGQGGDVVHNASSDFLGHHAEHADLQHWQTHTFTFTKYCMWLN